LGRDLDLDATDAVREMEVHERRREQVVQLAGVEKERWRGNWYSKSIIMMFLRTIYKPY
jgi:hypothetical protein